MARLRRSDPNAPGFSRVRHGRGFSYLDASGARIEDDATLARIRAPRDPARVAGRVDLRRPRRPLAGDRHRRRRSTAVSLSRRLARATGPREVPTTRGVRRRAPRSPRSGHSGPAETGLPAAATAGGRRAAARSRRPADRLRGVSAPQRLPTASSRRCVAITCGSAGNDPQLRFPGKSGVEQHVQVRDAALARLLRGLRRAHDLPEVWAWRDYGIWRPVRGVEVNDYIRDGSCPATRPPRRISERGTRPCWRRATLAGHDPAEGKRAVTVMLREVAAQLGNTAAVAALFLRRPPHRGYVPRRRAHGRSQRRVDTGGDRGGCPGVHRRALTSALPRALRPSGSPNQHHTSTTRVHPTAIKAAVSP